MEREKVWWLTEAQVRFLDECGFSTEFVKMWAYYCSANHTWGILYWDKTSSVVAARRPDFPKRFPAMCFADHRSYRNGGESIFVATSVYRPGNPGLRRETILGVDPHLQRHFVPIRVYVYRGISQ